MEQATRPYLKEISRLICYKKQPGPYLSPGTWLSHFLSKALKSRSQGFLIVQDLPKTVPVKIPFTKKGGGWGDESELDCDRRIFSNALRPAAGLLLTVAWSTSTCSFVRSRFDRYIDRIKKPFKSLLLKVSKCGVCFDSSNIFQHRNYSSNHPGYRSTIVLALRKFHETTTMHPPKEDQNMVSNSSAKSSSIKGFNDIDMEFSCESGNLQNSF